MVCSEAGHSPRQPNLASWLSAGVAPKGPMRRTCVRAGGAGEGEAGESGSGSGGGNALSSVSAVANAASYLSMYSICSAWCALAAVTTHACEQCLLPPHPLRTARVEA